MNSDRPWVPRKEDYDNWMAWRRSLKDRLPSEEALQFQCELELQSAAADELALSARFHGGFYDTTKADRQPDCSSHVDLTKYMMMHETMSWNDYRETSTHVRQCFPCGRTVLMCYAASLEDKVAELGEEIARPILRYVRERVESFEEVIALPESERPRLGYVEKKYGYAFWRNPDDP